ncbi:MAG: nuclear transport factor 2 family protein, partial [Steroidobacteraceae bacterium]
MGTVPKNSASTLHGTREAVASSPSTLADRLAALEAALSRSQSELEAVRGRLARLEDRDEVVNLQRIYGYYLDKALFAELIALFTDDVSLE